MSLIYTCPTCGATHDANISATRVMYMIENRIITLEDEKEDCDNCKVKIAAAQEEERKRIAGEQPKQNTV